ncbi:hypothetical protein [Nonomuraea sp. SYSU D8015]|uniref:hypothetical protein n=1 Tax=Nonomuraea sp. SYSU D8015 TaxID=2593644 RepID=UPI0016601F91|nr:hypothetical protein [Nonomuraea sp. SYSU D8015]
MTFDLRRLLLNGLIRPLPRSNRYVLTEDGVRIAVFYTKIYNRLLVRSPRPDQPQAPPELGAALKTITQHVDDYADYAARDRLSSRADDQPLRHAFAVRPAGRRED